MLKNVSAEMASLSGGEAMSFDGQGELEQDLNVLNNHIRNSYILSFGPNFDRAGAAYDQGLAAEAS